MAITYAGAQKVKLTVLADEKGKIAIKITDKKTDKLIESKIIKYSESFSVPIDLSELGGGQYAFEIIGDNISHSQNVFISEMANKDVYATVHKLDDSKYSVKVYQDNTPISIKMYDDDGNVYFENEYTSNQNFTQDFDFSELSTDNQMYLSFQGNKSTVIKALK